MTSPASTSAAPGSESGPLLDVRDLTVTYRSGRVPVYAARGVDLPADVPVVTLATAHPAKFRDAVERATGVRPSLPSRVGALFEREESFDLLPAELDAITAYIAERAAPSRNRLG